MDLRSHQNRFQSTRSERLAPIALIGLHLSLDDNLATRFNAGPLKVNSAGTPVEIANLDTEELLRLGSHVESEQHECPPERSRRSSNSTTHICELSSMTRS